jgi:hypothetical protein
MKALISLIILTFTLLANEPMYQKMATANYILYLIDRIESIHNRTVDYIMENGTIPTKEQLSAYYNIRNVAYRNYDDVPFEFSVTNQKTTFWNLFVGVPSDLQKRLIQRKAALPFAATANMEDENNISITIPLPMEAISQLKKIDDLKKQHGDDLYVSALPPYGNSKIWIRPDGKGKLTKFFYHPTKRNWVDMSLPENLIFQSETDMTSVTCMKGMSVSVFNGNAYQEMMCSDTKKWRQVGALQDRLVEIGSIENILYEYLDEPVGSLLDNVYVPVREVYIPMEKMNHFWYGRDANGRSYFVAKDMSAIPTLDVKDGSMVWTFSDISLVRIFSGETNQWHYWFKDPYQWKRVFEKIPYEEVLYIESDTAFFKLLESYERKSLILSLDGVKGYHVATSGGLRYSVPYTSLRPQDLGVSDGCSITDLGNSTLSMIVYTGKYHNNPSDIRPQWRIADSSNWEFHLGMVEFGPYALLVRGTDNMEFWKRDIFLADNYQSASNRELYLLVNEGVVANDIMEHNSLSQLTSTESAGNWVGARLHADADGSDSANLSINKIFTANFSGIWSAGSVSTIGAHYVFKTPEEAYTDTARFNTGDTAEIFSRPLLWQGGKWVHATYVDSALAKVYFHSGNTHHIKFVPAVWFDQYQTTLNGSYYYTEPFEADRFDTGHYRCTSNFGMANYMGYSYMPYFDQTTAGAAGENGVPTIEWEFMWTGTEPVANQAIVYSGVEHHTVDNSNSYRYRCISEMGSHPADTIIYSYNQGYL